MPDERLVLQRADQLEPVRSPTWAARVAVGAEVRWLIQTFFGAIRDRAHSSSRARARALLGVQLRHARREHLRRHRVAEVTFQPSRLSTLPIARHAALGHDGGALPSKLFESTPV